MAFQEDSNDNPPSLSVIELDDEDILIEYNELMEVDTEEDESSKVGDGTEDEDEIEDQY